MKILDSEKYISEKLNIKPITKSVLAKKRGIYYKYFPKSRSELDALVANRINAEGFNCNQTGMCQM